MPKLTLLVATIAVVAAAPSHALTPGGSNYSWYQVDRPEPGTCAREPYGVIPNFNVPAARAQIESELAAMAQSGQRRLRIGIFHGHGLDTGTIMDSTGGDLSPQNRRNLAGLLAAVKAAGFVQVEVAFHPQGPAVPEWARWDEARFQENWNLIRHLRPIIRRAGIPYRLDLSNEAIPRPTESIMLEYSRRLWRNYTRAYGRDDTVGFSVIGDATHAARIRDVYGGLLPYTFDVHFYGGTGGLSEYELFGSVDRAMRDAGLPQPWIIGEAFYDDAAAASQLRDAIAASGRRVYYLTQWPLTRGSACADVDVGAPTAFDAYAAAGFDPLPDTSRPPRPVLRARRLAVDAHGRVEPVVGCPTTATRCYGTLALRARGRTLRAQRFSVYPPQTAAVRLRLSHAVLTAIRRSGRLRASVVLTVRSEDSVSTTRRTVRVVLVS